jgi:hypothetical protein
MLVCFRALADSESYRNRRAAFLKTFGVPRSAAIAHADWIQIALQDRHWWPVGLYPVISSPGFFLLDRFPFPLREFGVRVSVEASCDDAFEEVYLRPLSAGDLRHFANGHRVSQTDTPVGVAVSLNGTPRILETYTWLTAPGSINRSQEIREDLRTGARTCYFRASLDSLSDFEPSETLEASERRTLTEILASLAAPASRPFLDPVVVYARKNDAEGRHRLSLYLMRENSEPLAR